MQLKSILRDNLKLPLRKYILVSIGIILLLTLALRACNSRKNQEILHAFLFMNRELEKSVENFAAKSAAIYDEFDTGMRIIPDAVKYYRSFAYEVKEWADKLYNDINELKLEIIKICHDDIGNLNRPAKLMLTQGKGKELREKIENYRDFLISFTRYDPSLRQFIMETLDTEPRHFNRSKYYSWESSNFENTPMIAVITNLSKIQNNIRIAEAEIILSLLMGVGATDTRVNKLEVVVLAKSRYVTKGDTFEARILLAAYDSLRKPQILIGPFQRNNWNYELVGKGDTLIYDALGRAIYKVPTTTVGTFTLQGILQQQTPDGIRNFPFQYEYNVVESKAP